MRSISGKSLWKGCGENLSTERFPHEQRRVGSKGDADSVSMIIHLQYGYCLESPFPCESFLAPSSFHLRFIAGRGETFMNKVFPHTPSKHFFSACCARYG